MIIKDILILEEGPIQRLDDITLTVEEKYNIHFTQPGIVLSLHYNLSNSFLFANTTKVNQFKEKNSETNAYAMRWSNVSKRFYN